MFQCNSHHHEVQSYSAIPSLFVVLVVTCLQITVAVWETNSETVSNRSVVVMLEKQNWYTASEICKARGMNLLTIRNDLENQQAINLGKRYNLGRFWFGATDHGHEKEYVWTDTGMRIGYSRWVDGQPDDTEHDEDCAEINYERWNTEPNVWNDLWCKRKLAYICEEKKCITKRASAGDATVTSRSIARQLLGEIGLRRTF